MGIGETMGANKIPIGDRGGSSGNFAYRFRGRRYQPLEPRPVVIHKFGNNSTLKTIGKTVHVVFWWYTYTFKRHKH